MMERLSLTNRNGPVIVGYRLYSEPKSRQFDGHLDEVLFNSPAIQPGLIVEQVEDAVLPSAEQVLLVFVLSLEDIALREVLGCPDENPCSTRKAPGSFSATPTSKPRQV